MTESRYDAVIIGAGVAGLRAAIELAAGGARVAVVTKDAPESSSSSQAQGGIAVALSGDEDEIGLHEEDTLRAGAGLCDAPAVRALVGEGPAEVARLIAWGARFDREDAAYHLAREAAHSAPRILHAGGDATGREIVRALLDHARRQPGIAHAGGALALDLLRSGERCAGVLVLRGDGTFARLRAGAVVLATGGLGRCFKVTSNPPEATGDGVAMALRAGCALGDMEFVQFHPTALALPGAPPVLLTEALRGAGGVIRNRDGERFLLRDDPRGELAPRDVVARGIGREIARTGSPVLLDLAAIEPGTLERRFPGFVELCRRHGLDPSRDAVPVRPAAHYAMGGVVTDLDGRTMLRGLAAAGEVAAAGVHGANRLASNSLLEGLVFGARAARALLADGMAGSDPGDADDPDPSFVLAGSAATLFERLRDVAAAALCISRRGDRLARALRELEAARRSVRRTRQGITRVGVEASNALAVLTAVARAALWRRESRGAHYREDAPAPDDAHFRVHSRQFLGGSVFPAPVSDGEVPA